MPALRSDFQTRIHGELRLQVFLDAKEKTMKIATRVAIVLALLLAAIQSRADEDQAFTDVKLPSVMANKAASIVVVVNVAAPVEAATVKKAVSRNCRNVNEKRAMRKPLVWLTSYKDAMTKAESEHKQMLIHFYRPEDQRRAEAASAADSVANIEKAFEQDGVREKLDKYVLTKLPVEMLYQCQR